MKKWERRNKAYYSGEYRIDKDWSIGMYQIYRAGKGYAQEGICKVYRRTLKEAKAYCEDIENKNVWYAR